MVCVVNSRVNQPCKTGDRLIIFKDHDVKGRSVLFDSSVPMDNSQSQKEPATVISHSQHITELYNFVILITGLSYGIVSIILDLVVLI